MKYFNKKYLVTISQSVKIYKHIKFQRRYVFWISGVRKKLFVHEKNYHRGFGRCHSYYQL